MAKVVPCLHCEISQLIDSWFKRHGEREGDQVILDVSIAVSKLAEVVADLVEGSQDRPARRRALKFAHEALDAAIEAKRTGKVVSVQIQTEH